MPSVLEVREQRRIISAVRRLTDSGRAGGDGLPAPCPVLEMMEGSGQNIVSASALRQSTGGRSVILLGLERPSLVLETQSASPTALWTATGRAGHGGAPAARLVVEELGTEIGSVTNLSMEAATVEDSQETAGAAALGAVQSVVSSPRLLQ